MAVCLSPKQVMGVQITQLLLIKNKGRLRMIPQMLEFMRKNGYSKWSFWHFALENLLIIGAFGGPFVTIILFILIIIPEVALSWSCAVEALVLTILDIAAIRYINK